MFESPSSTDQIAGLNQTFNTAHYVSNNPLGLSKFVSMFNDNCSNCSGIKMSPADPLSPAEQVVLYVLYIFAIILGTAGNIISIIVFTRGRRCNTDIKVFLINLAVSDLMMALICLPFSFTSALLREWIFSAPLCPIILFTQILSVTVSVYTNTAISIDRFLAITYPLKLRHVSRKRIRMFIIIIWVVSVALCSVQLWTVRVNDNNICEEMWPGAKHFKKWYTVVVLIITYMIPVVFILVMYGLVCIQLWLRTTPGIEDQTRDARQLQTKKKVHVVKMLIVMITLFTLCWMPLHIFFLILDFAPDVVKGASQKLMTGTYYAAHWLAMSNSFQNPIIYGFLNDNFRSDLAEMLLSCCPCLSRFKSVQSAAMSNLPLSRISTRMTILERNDSQYGNGLLIKHSTSSLHSTPSNASGEQSNTLLATERRELYSRSASEKFICANRPCETANINYNTETREDKSPLSELKPLITFTITETEDEHSSSL